jgi:hypothetical protein
MKITYIFFAYFDYVSIQSASLIFYFVYLNILITEQRKKVSYFIMRVNENMYQRYEKIDLDYNIQKLIIVARIYRIIINKFFRSFIVIDKYLSMYMR